MNKSNCLVGAMALALVAISGVARADTVSFSYDTVISFTGTPASPSTGASWVDLTIADTATAGTVAVTITSHLVQSQTLTGLWLSTSAAPLLTGGLTITNATPAAQAPGSFAAFNAAPSNTQSGVSGGNTAATGALNPIPIATGGGYDVQLRFANNAWGALQNGTVETFNLVSGVAGFNAQSFVTLSGTTAGGAPAIRPYTLAGFTNFGGAGASGVGYAAALSAVVSVPEPDTYAMLLAGAGVIGLMIRRRKNA
jgi:hypothetical protein